MSIEVVPFDLHGYRLTRNRSGNHRRSSYLSARVKHCDVAMEVKETRRCRQTINGEIDLLGRYAVASELRIVRLQGRRD
jgi:hypothetical protein